MGNGFGSGEAHHYQVNEYKNPLNVHKADAKPWAFLTFQPALSADGTRVEMQLDPSLPDGNPLWRERDLLLREGYVAIVEGAYVVARKNSVGIPMTLELRNVFSMPAGGRLTCGVPATPEVTTFDESEPDANEMVELLNRISFSLPASDETVVLKGDSVYQSRAKYEAHAVWAGMDRAFDSPTTTTTAKRAGFRVEEDEEGEGGDDGEQELAPTTGREFFKDSHPVVRALRMYRADLDVAKGAWKTVKSEDGQHVSHNLSPELACRIRTLMHNTYLKRRRYTQFTSTTAAVTLDAEAQRQLNEMYAERLRDPMWCRPVVQVVVLLRVIYFGEGSKDPDYTMIQLE